MPKNRNRSRDVKKRAAKKRKNRDYQTRKLQKIAKVSVNPITSELTPRFNGVITDVAAYPIEVVRKITRLMDRMD